MTKYIFSLCFFLFFSMLLFSQETPQPPDKKKVPADNSVGLKFASDFNHFGKADEILLVDNWFSTGIFGVFYRSYTAGRGVEIGLNINHKGSSDKGLSLPIIMKDFDPSNVQDLGVTAIEMDLKVGPRFKGLHPKIGYILGYRVFREGFLDPGANIEINKFYFQLPFSLSLALPTNFGAVGFGATYELDITNVMKVGKLSSVKGGRQHGINLEINVTYNTRQ